MADFVTIVDFAGFNDAGVLAVENALIASSFVKTFRSDQGIDYPLPKGIYLSKSDTLNAQQVRDIALVAVRTRPGRYNIITVSGDIAVFLSPQSSA